MSNQPNLPEALHSHCEYNGFIHDLPAPSPSLFEVACFLAGILIFAWAWMLPDLEPAPYRDPLAMYPDPAPVVAMTYADEQTIGIQGNAGYLAMADEIN